MESWVRPQLQLHSAACVDTAGAFAAAIVGLAIEHHSASCHSVESAKVAATSLLVVAEAVAGTQSASRQGPTNTHQEFVKSSKKKKKTDCLFATDRPHPLLPF